MIYIYIYMYTYTHNISRKYLFVWTPCVFCIFDAVDISCTLEGLEVLVIFLNLQPDIVDLQEALQPLVFDDPSTSQPDDFWLHPCDCLPQQWGTEWPADPLSLENIPATSNGIFIPEPFPIVSGGSCAQIWTRGLRFVFNNSKDSSLHSLHDHRHYQYHWHLQHCPHLQPPVALVPAVNDPHEIASICRCHKSCPASRWFYSGGVVHFAL